MSLIINAHSIYSWCCYFCTFHKKKLWSCLQSTNVPKSSQWMNECMKELKNLDLVFMHSIFTLNSFGLRKKIHCTSPPCPSLLFSSFHSWMLELLKLKVVLLFYKSFEIQNPFLFASCQEKKKLWFKGNCTQGSIWVGSINSYIWHK